MEGPEFMRVWFLETGPHWGDMTVKDVFLDEKRGLRAYKKIVKRARKRHGIKISRYTYEDGSHISGWGSDRLRLRPVEVP